MAKKPLGIDVLKAAGAKFDGANKAWVFESWADLEAAIKAIKGE